MFCNEEAKGKYVLQKNDAVLIFSLANLLFLSSKAIISASGATPFLNMFGWILGGWVMLDSANKAQLIILKDKNNKFAKEKINTASFYCNTYLPLASSLQNTIKKSFYALENFN